MSGNFISPHMLDLYWNTFVKKIKIKNEIQTNTIAYIHNNTHSSTTHFLPKGKNSNIDFREE